MDIRKCFNTMFALGVARLLRARPRKAISLFYIAAATSVALTVSPAQQTQSPHSDPDHGVLRLFSPDVPRGDCGHCHDMHETDTGATPLPGLLFTENSNDLCYTAGGAGPCHQSMPSNYPADESSRIPEGFPDAGYFEYNAGGAKIHGVDVRNRWPGATVYDDASVIGPLQYFSPHRNDPDMPLKDPLNRGSCLNCHDAHQSQNPFDLLVAPYRGTGGYDEPTYPTRYQLCFNCHSTFGPPGMNSTSRSGTSWLVTTATTPTDHAAITAKGPTLSSSVTSARVGTT
jgi:hypothetical protein